VEQKGEDVYEPAPLQMQKDAVAFLGKQLFTTPEWLLDKNILNKINNPVATDQVTSVQVNVLNSLLSVGRLNRMAVSANRFGSAKVYTPDAMIDDVKSLVWSELTSHKPIDGYRRNLQKAYIDALKRIVNPDAAMMQAPGSAANIWNTDGVSVARAQLLALKKQVDSAIPGTSDKISKYHLQDVSDRIKKALDPKG
jgi:hypothetical protein